MNRTAAETRLPFGRVLEPPPLGGSGSDRYLVEHDLARGGMGDLYVARDRRLGRRVVLKEPRRDLDPFRNRLCQDSVIHEGQVLARLDHRHVVTILDVHERHGRHGIVLRHVDGVALDEAVDLGLAEILDLGRRIAQALAHIHDRGLVHLDLKLENVLLCRDGTPCLIDFGIAQAPGRVRRAPGASGIFGTPQIMAPEQRSDGEVSGRSDLFSFGMMLGELIGRRRVPPALTELVAQMLSIDPAQRPGDAVEVEGRLARLARVSRW